MSSHKPARMGAPFRIKETLPPGFLTREDGVAMGQADFLACGELWWPAQRPVDVVTAVRRNSAIFARHEDYGDMVRWWTELGFVVRKGRRFVEDERNPIQGA